MLHIRLFGEGDSIEALTEFLHRAYGPIGQQGINYTAVDQTPEVTANRVLAGVCLLACDGEEVVGTVCLRGPRRASQCEYLTRPNVAYFSQFAVAPDRQGQGLGAMLIDAALSMAREDGFEELVADVAEPMTRLIAWYCRNGFEVFDALTWTGKNHRSVLIRKRLDA